MQHLRIHARRGLKEMFDSNGSPIAKEGLKRIAQLYKIEDKIRGEAPATRQFVRWTESAPLVNAFGVWLDEQRSRVSPRSRLGEKLTYIANQWDGLLVFLYDGRVEMDSNFVENRIRPIKTMESFCTPCSSIWKHWD
ncbi:MAG: transposase, partial [Defluviicoccus sp.]|nr:transposase [Defluviicoccus sp.]